MSGSNKNQKKLGLCTEPQLVDVSERSFLKITLQDAFKQLLFRLNVGA